MVGLNAIGCDAVQEQTEVLEQAIHDTLWDRAINFTGDEIEIHEVYWDDFGVKKVLLDPGHGCDDPGASGATDQAPTEAESMWNLVQALEKHLESTGHFEVYTTRSKEDQNCLSGTKVWKRGKLAARMDVDIMISLHADGGSSSAQGSWFIWTSEQDGLLSQESEWLAVTLGASFVHQDLPLFSMTETLLPGESFDMDPSRGSWYVATQPQYGVHTNGRRLAVLRNSRRPTVLIETHFIQNPDDAERFQGPKNLESFYRGIELGLLNYFAWKDGRLATKDQLTDGYWTIQVKATLDKDEAEDTRREFVQAGMEDVRVEIHEIGEQTWHRVRIGKYQQRQELDVSIHSLQVKGWSDYWVDQVSTK